MTEQLAHIAAGGDRLAALEALRDRLAQEIDTTMDPRAIPNLAHQFVKVLSEIDTLPARGCTGGCDRGAAASAAGATQLDRPSTFSPQWRFNAGNPMH